MPHWKGFYQWLGVDFHETFSLITKLATIWLVLSLILLCGWPLKKLDVNSFFLYGHLIEDIYMCHPLGFVDKNNLTYVCHLKKVIYRLKSVSRTWYNELHLFLLSIEFVDTKSDTLLFFFKKKNLTVYLLSVCQNRVRHFALSCFSKPHGLPYSWRRDDPCFSYPGYISCMCH